MVGELYKSSMGWAIRYPIFSKKNYDTTFIPINNQSKITEDLSGKIVPFSIKFKSKKGEKGKMPYAEIELN